MQKDWDKQMPQNNAFLTFVLIFFIAFGVDKKGIQSEQVLSFSNAVLKLGPPSSKTASAYLDIFNHSDSDCVIDKFSFAYSQRVELHESVLHMDMMKMRVNKNLVVLAKQEIKLEPLGKHLMLIELDALIRETPSSKIIFHSENCGNFDVVFKNEN